MGKQEILPPIRRGENRPAREPDNVATVVRDLTVTTGDPIDSMFLRWRAQRHSRTIDALTTWTKSEAALFDARNKAAQSYTNLLQSTYELEELPEKFAHQKAVRRLARANELRDAQHRYEAAELHRLTDIARAETVLVDAQQALRAQREFGYTTYELAWKKKSCEMLDVELSVAERRAILREHLGERERSETTDSPADLDETITDSLYEARAQLVANGLDATRVEAALERLKRT